MVFWLGFWWLLDVCGVGLSSLLVVLDHKTKLKGSSSPSAWKSHHAAISKNSPSKGLEATSSQHRFSCEPSSLLDPYELRLQRKLNLPSFSSGLHPFFRVICTCFRSCYGDPTALNAPFFKPFAPLKKKKNSCLPFTLHCKITKPHTKTIKTTVLVL